MSKASDSPRHVLVTGGAGFVGSHLVDLLLARGYAVTVMDNEVTGRRSNLDLASRSPLFSYVHHDVSRPFGSSDLPFIARYGLHGVFHFACPASPVDFDKIPFEILEVDSLGTIHAVKLALAHEARLLLASTSEIYGDPLVHPQTEDYWGNVNTIGPRSCYDETKRFAEAYVSTAQRQAPRGFSKPLNAGIVRIFNTYGPRMRPDDGRVVPELCMQALRGEPLTVHGGGKQTRSFCFVSDLVAGIFKLFESDVQVPVNIGNPVERTILEFAEVLNRLSGKEHPIRHLPGREDDPKRRCPEITRARTLLQWEPRVSLEDGLRQTLEFFRECADAGSAARG
jgi:dTDP-glucose 4,6-dehydratase